MFTYFAILLELDRLCFRQYFVLLHLSNIGYYTVLLGFSFVQTVGFTDRVDDTRSRNKRNNLIRRGVTAIALSGVSLDLKAYISDMH